MPLKPFTLIGATTRTGLLSAPLRDRFQMREHLDFYTVEELAEIVRRNAKKLRVEIIDDAATEIAARSRGTPRLANNRLRWVRDYAQSKADGRISLAVARDALEMQGIDPMGLDPQDRKYLETIARVFGGGPVGRRGGGPHHESSARHADRRSRAVSLAERTGDPHASRPQTHTLCLRSSRADTSARSKTTQEIDQRRLFE